MLVVLLVILFVVGCVGMFFFVKKVDDFKNVRYQNAVVSNGIECAAIGM